MKLERETLLTNSNFEVPPLGDSIRYLQATAPQRSAPRALEQADATQTLLFQPRCGVGGHQPMLDLLKEIETLAEPNILSVTIDSYTRLKKFTQAEKALTQTPHHLNGYPLVNHGWQRGRELIESVDVPLEIRHGSPDARLLFEVALAAGFTSFEGGGIGYNLPYCKSVPLHQSLTDWNYIDKLCGELARANVIIDRELFGTLSAVLMPPEVCLAMTLLEAILADRAGVRCISWSYPQGGHLEQDVAALRAIRVLAQRYLSPNAKVYPVLHEFMGAFPKQRSEANALILFGALTARFGRATKLITKSHVEALGIPSATANAMGIVTAKMASSPLLEMFAPNWEHVEEETAWILEAVAEIVEPVLQAPDLINEIDRRFNEGLLDIPFATSCFAKSAVMPLRDAAGAIRFLSTGNLPFSQKTKLRQQAQMAKGHALFDPVKKVYEDICFFSDGNYRNASRYAK